HLANGIAFGNASHGLGTARASQRNEDEGVIASLTMVLAGLFMVFLGPSLIHGVMLFGQV
ncbi:LrgB family protein, partial [Psychrobacter faecalis]